MTEENENTTRRREKVIQRWGSKHKGNRWKGGTAEEVSKGSGRGNRAPKPLQH